MLHFRRYFASLAVLLAACGTYALAVAPWVEPPPVKRKLPVGSRPVHASPVVQSDLERLFPDPSAWERNNPKIVETEQCTLLIQDYLPTEEGHLELKPCTLIFYAKGRVDPASGLARRRPIVLQAPQGALLEFDKPLDPIRAKFGRVEKGTLAGTIHIFSPPTDPGGRDALQLTTSSVHLDRDRVTTANDVAFRYGDSTGSGRGLTIALLPKQEPAEGGGKSSSLGGVQSLQLDRIDKLSIATEGSGLFGDMLGGEDKIADAESVPIEVRCRGPFIFDILQEVATFEDQVEIVRALPGMPTDRLKCDRLLLEFALKDREGGDKQRATAATGANATDDPLAGRIERVIAFGAPATLEAPSSGVRASAARMEYSLAKQRITLRPDEPADPASPLRRPRITEVSLQQDEQHFVARDLQYDLAERGKLGRLVATGPGQLRLLNGRGSDQQLVTARWQKNLLIRPDDRYQVISLLGQASITAEPMARFAAEELHLWVLEVPAPAKPATDQPPSDRPQKPRFTVIPDRMFAAGHVTLRSPQLDADTARLEAWFLHRPPEPSAPIGPAPAPDPRAPLREPVARIAWQQNQPTPTLPKGVIRPPSLQKFHVNGELVQLQLVVQGRQFDLEDLTLRGHATIDETRTEAPGQEPIHIAGDLLVLRHGTTPEATVEVTGEPAEVAGRGLSLIARKIHVHRGQNRMSIDGPGEATLPAPDGDSLSLTPALAPAPPSPVVREPSPAAPAAPPERLHLVWQKGLVFDGLTAKFEGEVQARTKKQVALTETLQATMSQRIDFGAASLKQRPDLARLHLDGGVFIENRGEDEAGQKISHDQMQFPNLTIDRAAGTLHANGPGWVSTVRKRASLPGSPLANAPQREPLPPGQKPPPPLASVHIAFERAIEGNLAKRQITFQHQVKTTYSPAYEFTDLIKAEQKADLGEQGVLMESDYLTLTEMRLGPTRAWFEMEAGGNARVVGQRFDVVAVKVRYTSDKEVLSIEGDGRADAQVWYETTPGQPRGYAAARRFRYWVRDEAFEGDGFSAGSFEFLGGKLKLPGARR